MTASTFFTSKRQLASILASTLVLSIAFTSIFTLGTAPVSAEHTQCSDGIDNDGDGVIDYPQDDDCSSLDDDYEGVGTSGNFITVTDERDKVQPGGSVVYLVTLKQQRDEARIVNVSLHLPFQSNIVSASDGGAVFTDRITWTNVSVYRNVTRTLQVHANVSPDVKPGQYLITRALVEGHEATDTTLVENYVTQSTDTYGISISDGKDFVSPGEHVTYTTRVRNLDSVARTGEVRVNLPSSTYFVSNSAGGKRDSYNISWSNVTFLPGESKAFTVTVQIDPNTRDRMNISARASIGAARAADQTVVKVGGVGYDAITTQLTDGRNTAERGQALTYRLTVTNTDATNVATNVAVDAGLPLYGEFVSATDNGYFDGTNIRWLIVNIAPKESRKLTFTVRVRPDAPMNTILTASAVSDGITGSVSRDTTKVVEESTEIGSFDVKGDVLFRKISDRSEAFPGGSIRYTLMVRNTLDHVISDAVISDRYDGTYLSLESYENPANLTSQSDGNMRWQVPVLQPGESWQTSYILAVSPKAPAGMDLSNVASIRGNDLDGLALTEKVRMVKADVMKEFPQTGGAMDAVLGLLGMIGAAGSVIAQRRKISF